MANILVIRLSAIGDVAMTVPVIYSAAKANPTDSFTAVSYTHLFVLPAIDDQFADLAGSFGLQ